MKLTGEISNRDNNIFKLKKYCVELDKYALDKNMEEVPSDLFEKIQSTIKLYRINTVNVINKIMRLRELFSYYELFLTYSSTSLSDFKIFELSSPQFSRYI